MEDDVLVDAVDCVLNEKVVVMDGVWAGCWVLDKGRE